MQVFSISSMTHPSYLFNNWVRLILCLWMQQWKQFAKSLYHFFVPVLLLWCLLHNLIAKEIFLESCALIPWHWSVVLCVQCHIQEHPCHLLPQTLEWAPRHPLLPRTCWLWSAGDEHFSALPAARCHGHKPWNSATESTQLVWHCQVYPVHTSTAGLYLSPPLPPSSFV